MQRHRERDQLEEKEGEGKKKERDVSIHTFLIKVVGAIKCCTLQKYRTNFS